MEMFNILSLNVRGLRDSKKRREIFRWLKRYYNGAKSIIFLQETHSVQQDVKTWEREWGSTIIMSHGTSNSKGVAILLPIKHDFDIESYNCDNEGRSVTLFIKHEQNEYCFINVYAPTQDHENDQLKFLDKLQTEIETNIAKKIVVGGDFNVCLESIDKSSDSLNSKPSDKLKQIMEEYDLLDIWRIRNPDMKRYTWRRHNPRTQSRLDFWLIGAELSYDVVNCDIMPSIKTDHSLITLKLENKKASIPGRGFWKFNANLLSDLDYIGFIKGFILMQLNDFKNVQNCSLKWELIKMEIRNATISYSKTQAYLRREYENELHSRYQEVHDLLEAQYVVEIHAEFMHIKDEIENINAIKTEGARIRSKAIYVEHNEKNSKFFINLEKKNACIKNITRLKLENDTEVIDTNSILDELSKFYQNLYGPNKYDTNYEKYFFQNQIPKISDGDTYLCDELITIDECTKALLSMKPNKSPGTDGLTVEFYRYFWNDIKALVYDSILSAFDSEILSFEQKRGVLRLIPKKGKDLTLIKNWRPISLLNTDYKLLTRILSSRLQKVLPSVISKDQSGYLKGRNIGINIRSIFDVIESAENNDSSTLLAFLDFEKAFDKLNWIFLQKTLQSFGFGQSFRKWVKIIYTDIESCIINNGATSQYFKLKSGIRQGCPLSALLFILCVEILAIEIKNNDKIQGINIGNTTFKITQLADDTTLFLKDIDSLQEALQLMIHFEKLSGLKLNDTKTEIFQVGPPLTTNYSLFKLKWEKERIYALGTWFYKDKNKSILETFEGRLKLISNILDIWSHRNLTWIGKITVIKTLCISRINYAICNIETPEWFLKQTKDLLEKFLWSSKPARVKNVGSL